MRNEFWVAFRRAVRASWWVVVLNLVRPFVSVHFLEGANYGHARFVAAPMLLARLPSGSLTHGSRVGGSRKRHGDT